MPVAIFKYLKTRVSIYVWIFSVLFFHLWIHNYANCCSYILFNCPIYKYVGFEVITSVSTKGNIYLIVMPYSSVKFHRSVLWTTTEILFGLELFYYDLSYTF
jgi:hypothetical protein